LDYMDPRMEVAYSSKIVILHQLTWCHIPEDLNLISNTMRTSDLMYVQQINKFLTFNGTSRFVIMFTRTCPCSLSWAD
jgi:hypothetical protein